MTDIKKDFYSYIKKDLYPYIKKKLLTPIIGICIISLYLLIKISPVASILWLCISTLYLLYMNNYKDISKIWLFTIGMWYLIFTTSLHEITIIIGFEHTEAIFIYLFNNSFIFESLCFQTLFMLDFLSAKLGFPIYYSLLSFSGPKPLANYLCFRSFYAYCWWSIVFNIFIIFQ